MSFYTRAEEALRIAGDLNIRDFYPSPFPEDVPTIELQKISLSKLLNGDEAEGKKVFEICCSMGFFYLDMLDHPIGRQIWRNACKQSLLSREILSVTPREEKCKYKALAGVRVFDRGYLVRLADQEGQPDEIELFNVPQSEFFGTKIQEGGLPSWISKDQETFKDILKHGNTIACAVLTILEKQLQLPAGSFTKLHRLTDDSSDFVRILRYPGATGNLPKRASPFPSHRDATSVTLLFTWLGGLQIADPNANFEGLVVKDEDWYWVRPEPGYAIVNLGDAMELFTNKILRSGVHRVGKAPGEQRSHDRMSLLIATRPENKTLMKAFESNCIPHCEKEGEVLTSVEWGYKIVADIQRRAQEVAAATRDTSILENA